jgi:hypothetical protein
MDINAHFHMIAIENHSAETLRGPILVSFYYFFHDIGLDCLTIHLLRNPTFAEVLSLDDLFKTGLLLVRLLQMSSQRKCTFHCSSTNQNLVSHKSQQPNKNLANACLQVSRSCYVKPSVNR